MQKLIAKTIRGEFPFNNRNFGKQPKYIVKYFVRINIGILGN